MSACLATVDIMKPGTSVAVVIKSSEKFFGWELRRLGRGAVQGAWLRSACAAGLFSKSQPLVFNSASIYQDGLILIFPLQLEVPIRVIKDFQNVRLLKKVHGISSLINVCRHGL